MIFSLDSLHILMPAYSAQAPVASGPSQESVDLNLLDINDIENPKSTPEPAASGKYPSMSTV